jgi:hypothetical protein
LTAHFRGTEMIATTELRRLETAQNAGGSRKV